MPHWEYKSLLHIRYGVATVSRLLKMTEVSFAKEPCERDDILQKRPMILRSVLIIATSYWVRSHPSLTLLKIIGP